MTVGKRAGDGARVEYEIGQPINVSAKQLVAWETRKERNGMAQVERVLQGLEGPASDVEGDRARVAATAANLAVVGHPTVDIRAREMVTGAAIYPVDVFPSGVLYVRALRSPYPHAKVTKLDLTKAKALKGVVDIVTYDDIAKLARAAVTGEAASAGGTSRPELSGEPVFVGFPIAAVAAESDAIAQEALGLIDVQYQQLPFVLDAEQALKPSAPPVREGLKTNAAFNPQFTLSRGDVQKAMATADVTVDLKTQSSYEEHVAFERHVAVIEWHDDGTMTVYSSTQYPHGMRDGMAQSLRIPQSKIRVLANKTGGGFGDKTGKEPYHVYTALLAMRTRRPVKYELTRKDIFYETGHNYPKSAEIHVGVKKDGSIVAISGTSYIPTGGYNENLGNSDDWEAAARLYKCDNVDFHGYSALTNTVITSPLRCVGEPSGLATLSVAMDMVAEKLNMDPLQFHLQNIETKVDQTSGLPYSSCGLQEAIQKGAAAFNWSQRWKGWTKNTVQLGDDPVRGVGMMVQETTKGAAILARTAVVQIDTDGSVSIHTGAADIGSGQATTWSMIAAEALGVPLSQVRIYCMDTEAGPDSSGMFESRGTKTVGMAVKAASEDAAKQILEFAAGSLSAPKPRGQGLKVTAADLTLDLANKMVVGKNDPTIKFPVGAAIGAGGTVIGTARLAPFIPGYAQKTFAASFYEVEVDPGTGFVHVTDAMQVHDVGKAINPTGVINQIEGGIMQGIDKALSVRLIYDPATGVLTNPNLDDYKLHTIDQLPDKVEALFVEPIDAVGPYGAKGVGEPPIASALSAVSNAIYNAIGVRMTDAPYTPAKILAALKAKTV